MLRVLRGVRHDLLAVRAVLIVAILLTWVAAAHAAASPVLGSAHAFPDGKGFGQIQPRHVFLGGDPTGDVTGVRWHGWGAGETTGFGIGWCPGRTVAAGHSCPVSLHAYDLGSCHGRRAYRALAFYFKPNPHRRWMFGSK